MESITIPPERPGGYTYLYVDRTWHIRGPRIPGRPILAKQVPYNVRLHASAIRLANYLVALGSAVKVLTDLHHPCAISVRDVGILIALRGIAISERMRLYVTTGQILHPDVSPYSGPLAQLETNKFIVA